MSRMSSVYCPLSTADTVICVHCPMFNVHYTSCVAFFRKYSEICFNLFRCNGQKYSEFHNNLAILIGSSFRSLHLSDKRYVQIIWNNFTISWVGKKNKQPNVCPNALIGTSKKKHRKCSLFAVRTYGEWRKESDAVLALDTNLLRFSMKHSNLEHLFSTCSTICLDNFKKKNMILWHFYAFDNLILDNICLYCTQ